MRTATKAAASAVQTQLYMTFAPRLDSLLILLQSFSIILCTSMPAYMTSVYKHFAKTKLGNRLLLAGTMYARHILNDCMLASKQFVP